MKQKTFSERFKTFVARLWIADPYTRGYEVWIRLDERLPRAVGAKFNDQPRVEKFSRLIKRLSFLDYYALKAWLKNRRESLKHDWDCTEHFTGSIEQYCLKQIQICEEHLEVMD